METNFNFNSAICTSIEQSRKLLALGLKKETTDMHWTLHSVTQSWYVVAHPEDGVGKCISAWSLHRLLSMIPEYVTPQGYQLQMVGRNVIGYSYPIGVVTEEEWWYKLFNKVSLYDNLVDCIAWLIKEGYFNKEYMV